MALGQNCLRNLSYYLDTHRPDAAELAEWAANDPFSLQELLGHEDLTTVQNYMHMNDTVLQAQKRKYSPGDHIPTRMPGPRETRRKSSQAKEQERKR